jgi:ABC-type proline/glycine betaine transport system permease subunit
VGAVAAAGGLGQPILAGFATYNTAFIIEGALLVAVSRCWWIACSHHQ